jgi:F-type H+-transporting ATPase subunit delta
VAKTSEKIARRYARALFDLCTPAQVEECRGALDSFAKLWKGSKELREAVLNPAIPLAERAAVLKEISQKIAPGNQNIEGAIQLLFTKGRLVSIPDVAVVFGRMVDVVKKLLALEISSAFPLSEMERGGVLNQVQKEFGGLASIHWITDSNLIGGMRVKAGDKLLDASVRGSLERMKQVLLSA